MKASSTRTTYHHGDLRATLLRVGLELVAERGINGFTLREVARRAGVSHAAPYHHFADRGALVRAIVAESYADLAVALEASATKGGDDAVARLEAMGEGYVAFALANPDRYRLMFRTELAGDGSEADEVDRAGADAFGALVTAVEAGARLGSARGRRGCRDRGSRVLGDGPRRLVAADRWRARRAGQPAGTGPSARSPAPGGDGAGAQRLRRAEISQRFASGR